MTSASLPIVHVDRDDMSAKFWLESVALSRNLGYSAHELRRIERLVIDHVDQLRKAWHE
jgi:hypothetical protein